MLLAHAVVVVVFTVAGVHKNSQINELHHDGVPVTVTITNCLGLMGGSGSNAAGYSCTGSFTVHGHRYTESLPGIGFHQVGSTLPARVGCPAIRLSYVPGQIVRTQQAAWRVFLLPAVLLASLRSCWSSSSDDRRRPRRAAAERKLA